MTPEIGNGDKAWDLLIGRLDSIEEKVDGIRTTVDSWQGACVTHNTKTTEHEIKIQGQGRAIGWLYGILTVIILASIVERLVGK